MHWSPGELNQKRVPSFRTAFFADPESLFFNSLLDTGSSPVWRILVNGTAVTFQLCSRRGAENTQVQGTSNEGQGKTKTIFTLLLMGESWGEGGPVRRLNEMKREQPMTCLGYCNTASGYKQQLFLCGLRASARVIWFETSNTGRFTGHTKIDGNCQIKSELLQFSIFFICVICGKYSSYMCLSAFICGQFLCIPDWGCKYLWLRYRCFPLTTHFVRWSHGVVRPDHPSRL